MLVNNPPETSNILSLYELNRLIQKAIDDAFFGRYFWIKAEIHKLNLYKHSGHAYPELVEKKENEIICQMRGIIWKTDFLIINQKFINTVGEPLSENISALMLISVKFNPKYGLSLYIKDIDPYYTLGELEKEKKQTIEKLRKEGIFDNNKKLPLPLVPQNLAIISVETSKGYNDLITTFQKYKHQFQINHDLYPSLLQGENAAVQIREQLEKIKSQIHLYDAVLIIRGGGGEIGLSCYNNYELCKTITTFPIPIITGIGHSTNFTVAEMVAHTNGITPTDTAMIIISQFERFLSQLNEYHQYIHQLITNTLQQEKMCLQKISQTILQQTKEIFHQQKLTLNNYEYTLINIPKAIINKNKYHIIHLANKLKITTQTFLSQNDRHIQKLQQDLYYTSKQTISHQKQKIQQLIENLIKKPKQIMYQHHQKLKNMCRQINILHPQNTLKRGYTIIFNKNKIIKSSLEINNNDTISIRFHDMQIEGNIINIQKNNYEW